MRKEYFVDSKRLRDLQEKLAQKEQGKRRVLTLDRIAPAQANRQIIDLRSGPGPRNLREIERRLESYTQAA